MKDKVTEIELNLELSKLVKTAQGWAKEAEFAIQESTSERILFGKEQRSAGTQWVSLKGVGANTKLTAWFAPKSLGPDEEGSLWKGNKQPIPAGVGLGPVRRFKKDFNILLEKIGADSNDPSIKSTIQKVNPPAFTKESFAKGLMVLAILIFLNSAMSIFTGTQMLSNQLLPDFAESLIQEAIVELTVGIVLFTTAQLLKKGNHFPYGCMEQLYYSALARILLEALPSHS